jgi:hypothetical protein
MTHSAGHRGYKASAAAASKDNELYGAYSQDRENWPARNGISTRQGSPRQSTEREPSNLGTEPRDRRNR